MLIGVVSGRKWKKHIQTERYTSLKKTSCTILKMKAGRKAEKEGEAYNVVHKWS